MKIIKKIKLNKGFTIVETLVAVAIMMIAIAGPLTVAQKSLMASLYAKDQVIASFLAQDLMEYLKNIRDSDGFISFESSYRDCTISNRCSIDTTTGSNTFNSNFDLYNNDSFYTTTNLNDLPVPTGLPSPPASEKTKFSRNYYFSAHDGVSNLKDERKVVVTVYWKNGGIDNSFILESQFFDISR